jgi:hypothetical protein
MKAADHDRYAQRPELPAEIKRARKLVGLHADQPDHAAARRANPLGHGADVDGGVALVARLDLDIDVGAEHALARALRHQAIDAGQAV